MAGRANASSLFSGASWIAAPASLVFTVGAAIPFAARIRLRVPAAANIILPLSGIRKDDERLQVALDSVFGQIIPAAVFSTVAVGAMQNTVLAFPGVPRAAAAVQLEIRFTPTMDVSAGTVVSAVLPAFTLPVGQAAAFSIQVGGNLNQISGQKSRPNLPPKIPHPKPSTRNPQPSTLTPQTPHPNPPGGGRPPQRRRDLRRGDPPPL